MNILMILNSVFPGDLRVEKEYKALKLNGHNVIVVANEEYCGNEEGFSILRIPVSRRLNRVSFLTSRDVPRLRDEIERKLNGKKIDVVHVHDLAWALFGLRISKSLGAKLVLDFHENLPAAVQEHMLSQRLPTRIIKRLMGTYSIKKLREYELDMVERADRVIIVVPEALNRFTSLNTPWKFVVVSNTEDPKHWKPKCKKHSDIFVILYIGSIGPHRGVETLINSLSFLKENVRVQIRVVGIDESSKYCRALMNRFRNFIEDGKLIFDKWVPFELVQEVIAESDLCAIPHNRSEHTETTVPHKLFQYMAMQKPVLVSDVAPLRRIIEECNCGVAFAANDSRDCAKVIQWCVNNHSQLQIMGKKGRTAIEENYSWVYDSKNLIKLYETLGEE